MKRIIPREHLRRKRTRGTNQDGSREFISLLAAICADGTFLPPSLIYQGDSYDLQDSWLEDFDHSKDEAYFAISKKGWTNDELGFSWLSKVFEPRTKEKAGNSKRLLIVDGHSSHINLQYIDFCDQHNIILAVFPPHSTHRLQPLDVGIFSPLATAYSQQINNMMISSQGFSRITKRTFWLIFRTAWRTALTIQNIRSAFATTGIHPLAPEKILNQLQYETPPPSRDGETHEKTPTSVRGLRRAIKAVQNNQTHVGLGVDLIIRASEKLSIQNEILAHENKGLQDALFNEKKRRKRGKPMGFLHQNQPGQAQFFSPTKIAAVRARKEELEAQKEQERIEKEQERLERAAERMRKANEVKKRKESRERARMERDAQKQQQKEARQAQKEMKQQLRTSKEYQKNTSGRVSYTYTSNRTDRVLPYASEQVPRTGRHGRNTKLPARFQD